ncbi:hypothetical protein OROMI_022591 [Orobanche minor]
MANHEECAVICMILLLLTALIVFPYYMQQASIAGVLLIFPLSVLLYVIFMAIFVW